MDERELADEVCIMDKACRQCGAELAQGGLAALGTHRVAINALMAKLKRLEAVKAAQMNGSLPHPTSEERSDTETAENSALA